MPGWELTVDRDTCIGSGLCVGATEGVFELVEGRSRPISPQCSADEAVLLAAESCPAGAIRVVESSSGRTLFTDTES
ncbi:ferredoxin [Nocardia sp. NPDC049190]|uniref:ferredoxin n=1 Tax=Nocardia sp. NPDC049190 TaxID=3155650 RepID=UPI0033DEECC6